MADPLKAASVWFIENLFYHHSSRPVRGPFVFLEPISMEQTLVDVLKGISGIGRVHAILPNTHNQEYRR